MTKYIKISNDGVLDVRLMTLMGGTTKEGQPEKIGFFGTGGKYVMSYMVRNNLSLKIFVGEREVDIEVKEEEIAGTMFKIVYIDGQRTSVTDKMGRDWKPWYILREVWSNALDEGNAQKEITEVCNGMDGTTTFYLEASTEFLNIWNNWSRYFIQDLEPISVQDGFKLYSGASDCVKIYKQGVLVCERKCEGGSIFSYDFDKCYLNELRELTNSPDSVIYQCLSKLTDKKMIEYFLEHVAKESYEGSLDYDYGFLGKFNDTWREVIGEAKIIHHEAYDKVKAKQVNIDLSHVHVLPKKVFKALTKRFDGISSLRVTSKNNEFFECIEPGLEQKLKEAIAILEECDYWMHPELKFIFGEFGNKSTLASVNLDKKEVLISTKHMGKSMFDFIAMLVEENEHFNTGFSDETREFQQHFINLYTQSMLSKHEIKL